MSLSLIPTLLIGIVALEHFYIMYLETIATTSQKQPKPLVSQQMNCVRQRFLSY